MSRSKTKIKTSMFAVLGILAIGPQSGYDIKKLMERSTRYFWNENYGQIYPHLSALLDNQDVTMHIEKQDGKPDRKVYTITDKGKKSLEDWLRTPLKLSIMEQKNELLLRLFFGQHASPETNIQHLKSLKEQLQDQLFVLETMEDEIRSCHPDDPNLTYWLITINYGKLQSKALIEWCEDSIQLLNGSAE
ncbi:PadR family transcriptional regulator [Marinicrinis lubricantis]|uniref:PadR family transcriptional regulator n=1 Tax=Marinicrinis lubricantis TaxID=2086470 RepID=A0ABW1ILN0_9BACL